MPSAVGKSRSKGREGRHSRSRNTTPSSSVSAPLGSATETFTAFLDIPTAHLMVPSNITYDLVLDRHGAGSGIPDTNHLDIISKDLKELASLAEARSDVNNKAMRDLSERRKAILDAERDRERREAEDARRSVKREDDDSERPMGKKKRAADTERPPAHGAHGVARQDGLDLPVEAAPQKQSSSPVAKPALSRESSSPLSEASRIPSPTAPTHPSTVKAASPDSDDSSDHQPTPAAAQPQYQTFGANPLTFDDPTVYEIRPVTEDMTDEEKREIYCVSSFPQDDLADLIAGVPPNKDYSNAVKPSNQVQAHTFAGYLDGYLRPLKEEDIGFLNERGDRVTPFILPPRGKRHYKEMWSDDDGMMNLDMDDTAQLPPNQPRGALSDLDDDNVETDQISCGPVVSRLLSTLRFENRQSPAEEKPQTNGTTNGGTTMTNGDLPNGTQEDHTQDAAKPLPPATALPDNIRLPANAPNLSHAQIDDRLKAELRHIGFLSADDEPDYDAHLDDEVAERLRWLQERLRRVSLLNGARKRKVLELAEEQLAYQEYSTILEDLDGQVQQAYLKRARTAGTRKKNAKRPQGGIGGAGAVGGGVGASGVGAAVSKPGIGDVARQLMNRRQRWEEKIGPVFGGHIRRVRGPGEGIFGERELERFKALEKEMFDEEAE